MSLVLYQHPFALYCWKPLIALYERDVPFTSELVEATAPRSPRLWPPASIPILVDDGVVVTESSIIVEYLDRHGDAPPLIPTDPDHALQARLWDRVADGYVATPVQRIVGDALRPVDAKDPYGVSQAHATLDLAYATLDRQLSDAATTAGWPARTSRWPTAPRRPPCTTPTSSIRSTATPSRRWPPTSTGC